MSSQPADWCRANDCWLAAATETARWLMSVARAEDDALVWMAAPESGAANGPHHSLYYGGAGIILFFCQLYLVTKEPEYLSVACRTAKGIVNHAEWSPDSLVWSEPWRSKPVHRGLYLGSAGVAFALLELFQLCQDQELLDCATAALGWTTRPSIEWPTSPDIVTGLAGIGLVGLRVKDLCGKLPLLDAAVAAGHRALDSDVSRMRPDRRHHDPSAADRDSLVPGFAHGVAGLAFFLARLYQETGDPKFLKESIATADWLLAARKPLKRGAAWPHDFEGGQSLFYVGWCHGTVGIARLFYLLHSITGRVEYKQVVLDCSFWITHSGLLTKRLRGLWNMGRCCGLAGVVDFFSSLNVVFRNADDLRWAEAAGLALLQCGTSHRSGVRWIQAEFRHLPNYVTAHIGYAHGNCGIGLSFCRLACLARQACGMTLQMPDDPFPVLPAA